MDVQVYECSVFWLAYSLPSRTIKNKHLHSSGFFLFYEHYSGRDAKRKRCTVIQHERRLCGIVAAIFRSITVGNVKNEMQGARFIMCFLQLVLGFICVI